MSEDNVASGYLNLSVVKIFTKRTKQINVYSINAIAVTNILKSYY